MSSGKSMLHHRVLPGPTLVSLSWHPHRNGADDFRPEFCASDWCAPSVILTMIPYIRHHHLLDTSRADRRVSMGRLDATHYCDGNFHRRPKSRRHFLRSSNCWKLCRLHPMTVIVSIFVWGLIIGGGNRSAARRAAYRQRIKVLLARYVWRRRLRERAVELPEVAPAVPEPEIATLS